MKILYLGTERGAAQIAANALRDLAPDVRLAWAGSLSAGLRWIDDNRDVGALVIETEVQGQSCASFVDRTRGLGLTAPIIVAARPEAGTPLEALKAGADDYVVNNETFATSLRAAVSRTLKSTRPDAVAARKPLRILYVGDSALARQCFENRAWPVEIVEAVARPNGTYQPISPEFLTGQLPFDVLLVEHDHPGVDAFAIIKDVADRNLPLAVILVVEWDEKLAVPAFKLGASDCVVKASDAFRALLFKLERGLMQSALIQEQAESRAEHAATKEVQLREALARATDTEQRFDDAAESYRERDAEVSAKLERMRMER